MKKLISLNDKWSKVQEELQNEEIKLAYYDDTLIDRMGDFQNSRVLDYGSGPGVLAYALSMMDAEVKVYDIDEKMRQKSGEKIGHENVYHTVLDIPNNHFDSVICNLVMCIVDDKEVLRVANDISKVLKDDGKAYIGFCNPLIYDLEESQLDLRPKPQNKYYENHMYMKTKKEGGYQIIEMHRPIEWYEKIFSQAGLNVENKHFTPSYESDGRTIEDFVILELSKK